MGGKFDQELPVKITSSRTENNVLISFPTEKKRPLKQTNKQGECEEEDYDASSFVEREGIQSILSVFHSSPVECCNVEFFSWL